MLRFTGIYILCHTLFFRRLGDKYSQNSRIYIELFVVLKKIQKVSLLQTNRNQLTWMHNLLFINDGAAAADDDNNIDRKKL